MKQPEYITASSAHSLESKFSPTLTGVPDQHSDEEPPIHPTETNVSLKVSAQE